MKLVSIVIYKVAHNGEVIGPVYPMRGLKQGQLIFLSYV